ncbi:MAG: hypothetical protein ACFFD8_07625 [Candidatus Thorarchaeota archaeon]
MIRRTRIIIFLAIILGSTVVLGISSFYQIDTYRAMSFPVEITEIRIMQNESSGEYRRLEVDIRLYNPSLTLPLHFIWTDTRIYLNGETFRYGFGQKGRTAIILPGEFNDQGWHYSLQPEDYPIIDSAVASGNWNWLLYLEPYVQAGFLGREEVTRAISYESVSIVPISVT